MRRSSSRIITSVAATILVAAVCALAGQSASEMFQRAQMLDESNQNLTEAINLYAQVVAQANGQRVLAANAQYRIGLVYERLGKKTAAQRAFKIVVNQFADQTDVARRAQEKIAAAGPHNKATPTPVVKADTSPPNRQYLATFTALNGQYFSCPAIDSARHRLYVVTHLSTNPASDGTKGTPQPGQRYVHEPSTLIVIDTENYSILKTIPLPTYILNVAYNPANNKLYLSEKVNRHVRVIDTKSFSQYTIPVPGYPQSIAINPITRKVYVDSQGFAGNDKLFVIDADTSAVTGPLDLDGVAGGVLVNPSTNRIYASAGPRKTRVFSGVDNSVLTDLPGILVMAVDPASNRLYAQAIVNDEATLVAIDGDTHNVIASFDFDINIGTVAIDTGANRLYAAYPTTMSKHQIVAVDTSTNTELGRMTPCKSPMFLAMDEGTRHFYVCSQDTPAAMFVLARGALDGEIAEEFSDEFGSPVLDTAWTEVSGYRNYSLTENPGHLRSHVIASSPATPQTILFRKFRGDSWTIETKVSYSMGTSGGGRSFSIGIGFGSIPFLNPGPALGEIYASRHRDDWDNCCPGEFGAGFFDNGIPGSHSLPPNAADTYYLRIRRSGQMVTVESSDDGVDFTTILSHTFTSQIKGTIQYLSINSNTHSNNDAYADYNCVRLSKTLATQH
jgi:DNA-binding beta-propeller fold protein YncE